MAEHLPSHLQQRADAEVGAALRRCVATLPPRYSLDLTTNGRGTWGALARPPFMDYESWMETKREQWGDDPVEVLNALTEALETPR